MRYIVTADQQVNLPVLEAALKQVDEAYAFTNVSHGRRESGDLTHAGALYVQVEVNRPGDGLFEEELEELRGEAEEAAGEGREVVLATLNTAKAVVAVQLLFQNRGTEATLRRIDPLWEWLFANRAGLLQADGEGYYNRSGLILNSG